MAENTVLTDYISEKVTQGLLAGGIPIVLGAPNLGEEIQPGLTLSASPSSTIYPMFLDATRFSPAELATELRELDQSPERRMAFHAWMKALPSDEVPLVRYARRTAEHDFTVQGMMRPVCDMCEYYHERFDWKGETPERFGEAKGAR